MALTDMDGGVPPAEHVLELSNIERAENKKMEKRRMAGIIEKFPMQTHKPGGLIRRVQNEDELADALSKGWVDDIRKVQGPEREAPSKIYQMTVAEATALIAEHAQDGAKLAELIADEQVHGARAAVLELLAAAADSVGGKPAAAKAVKSAKKK